MSVVLLLAQIGNPKVGQFVPLQNLQMLSDERRGSNGRALLQGSASSVAVNNRTRWRADNGCRRVACDALLGQMRRA